MPKSSTTAAVSKPSKPAAADRPSKPRPDFPLFPHASGRWAKKVRGNFAYFGKIADDPKGVAALDAWLDQRDELLSGRKPRPHTDEYLRLGDLCNSFIAWKQELLDSGELTQRTYDQYFEVCALVCAQFGRNRAADDIRPEDFQALRAAMAKRWGPVRLGNQIQFIRSIFKYGAEEQLLQRPVSFGKTFKKPSAKTIRRIRTESGPRLFTPEQIHALLSYAPPNIKAMILLAMNCGMGNTDVAMLPQNAINPKSPWIDYPRRKTWIQRRIPLWVETTAAIRVVIAQRPTPKDPDDAPLLFIGPRGESYVGNFKGYRVTQVFDQVATKAGVEERTFYDFRRTFQTVGEGANDLAAVRALMGHTPPTNDMSSIYRQEVSDERLKSVTDHVHAWLFPRSPPKRKKVAK